MPIPPPPPGVLAVYSDIGCPWATAFVHRVHASRRRLGLEGRVHLEHRTFPLELVNRRPTPRWVVDAEVPVVAWLAPDFGWRMWSGRDGTYPATTLPALEAVQAAAAQGAEAHERLDLALRRAFYVESRCISIVPVILEVAEATEGVDADALEEALADGRARRRVTLAPEEVEGSPTAVAPDGTTVFNPGVTSESMEGHLPRVSADDPAVIDDLLRRTAAG